MEAFYFAAKGKKIHGIVIGRAQKSCDMSYEKWKSILKTKKELIDIPLIINLDFGHTTPIFTFPVGGYAKINGEQIVISDNK